MTKTVQIDRQVVLIAGANRGCGPETARRMAAEGHHVVLGAKRSRRIYELMLEIRLAGGSAELYVLDDAQPAEMMDFLAFAQDVHKRINMIINNA